MKSLSRGNSNIYCYNFLPFAFRVSTQLGSHLNKTKTIYIPTENVLSGEGQMLNFLANLGLCSKALRDYIINDT